MSVTATELATVPRRTTFAEPGPMTDVDAALRAAVDASRVDGGEAGGERVVVEEGQVPLQVGPSTVVMDGMVAAVQLSMDRRG